MIPIVVDAMGGDHAPRAVIEGVGQALDRLPHLGKLLLCGDQAAVEAELDRIGRRGDARLEIVHAADVVRMDEAAHLAIRGKRTSSIAVSVDLLKQGRGGAVFSAGHTGAAVAATVVKLRTLPGIKRPGIATVFPSPTGRFVLLDAGANVDSEPENLVQWAIMGEVYARQILGVQEPRIGILSVGEEDTKGNELTKETFKRLSALKGIRFVGNVEGPHLFANGVDVVVCDGFVGNVVLKCCESLAKALSEILKGLLRKNVVRMTGALLSRSAFHELKRLSDYAEYGGAPLLGINGVCIIGHGSSSPKAVCNGIRVAGEFIEHQVNDHIVERIGSLGLASAPAADRT